MNLGGYGTMEELLEMITWSQLGIHEKPVSCKSAYLNHWHCLFYLFIYLFIVQVGLLNVDGYYNSLLELFDKGVEEGFIEDGARHIVVSSESVEELFRKMEVNEREKNQGETSNLKKINNP